MGSIEAFIREHREDDVRQLALQGKRYPDVDMPVALEQIAGWQTARKKIPSWAAVEGIVYPPHLSMEQCSSEQTARYKVEVLSRSGERGARSEKCNRGCDGCSESRSGERGARSEKCNQGCDGCSESRSGERGERSGERGARREKCNEAQGGNLAPRSSLPAPRIIDLTGGLGVDFAFLAQALVPAKGSVRCGSAAVTATYVERQPHLCEAARHNFRLLGLHHAEVVCADANDYLHQLDQAYLIYMDPARRDTKGSRTYAISDCTPDVLAMEEELLEKAEWVMVKLSPMLDWHKAVSDLNRLGDVVRQVHIVSVGNECKELLLLLSKRHDDELTVHCVNDDSRFVFSWSEITNLTPRSSLLAPRMASPIHLYEPNASIMKAGCFALLQKRFNATPIGQNSHLFVSSDFIEDFPGRKFQILAVSSVNKIAAKMRRFATDRANVAVRNFPMTAEQLRKKLKLKDGGDSYLFGSTLEGKELADAWEVKTGPIVIIAKKT